MILDAVVIDVTDITGEKRVSLPPKRLFVALWMAGRYVFAEIVGRQLSPGQAVKVIRRSSDEVYILED